MTDGQVLFDSGISMLPQQKTSDTELREKIMALFSTNSSQIFANLRVGVMHGIVHLAGNVDSLAKRAKAEEMVQKIHAVRGVVNRIEAPGAPSPARSIQLNLANSRKNDNE